MASSTATALMPKMPLRYLPKPDFSNKAVLFEFSAEFTDKLAKEDQRRQEAYDASRQLQAAIWKARSAMEYECNSEQEDKLENDLDEILKQLSNQVANDNNTPSVAMEEYARYKAFRHFLRKGTLINLSDFYQHDLVEQKKDENYLAGACMGLTHDLARYAVGRATVQDMQSVQLARDLTDSLYLELLKFDFRNGPLRKKYDGVKYSLKHLERILYELSVTTSNGNDIITCGSKQDSVLVCQEEMSQIRKRMEERDNAREVLIKKCRDGQKAAKQAIFAIHRDDVNGAHKFLESCQNLIENELSVIIQQTPALRLTCGSLSALMEEYAEAKLFYTWIQEKRIAQDKNDFFDPAHFIQLESGEYLGGLCDFTGEVGRFAVNQGTKRDTNSVKWCLETNMSIWNAVQSTIGSICSNKIINKQKMDQLRTNVEKLERILYELSLIQQTGRSVVTAQSVAVTSLVAPNDYDEDDN